MSQLQDRVQNIRMDMDAALGEPRYFVFAPRLSFQLAMGQLVHQHHIPDRFQG